MILRILGPVVLESQGERRELGSLKAQLLIASLAVDTGHPVSIETLVDRLWDGEKLPSDPRGNVHVYASRLRKRLLRAAAETGVDAPDIARRSHAYVLEIHERDLIDAHRFQNLVTQANRAVDTGDDAQAVALLNRADGLWQGEALSGLYGSWPESTRAMLTERRLRAATTRFAAEFRMGHFVEQISELTALVDAHPDDEPLIRQLMLACYGAGRFADASRVYHKACQLLRKEFGANPGDELNHAYQGVLNRWPIPELIGGPKTPRESPRTSPDPVVTPNHPVPRNLPRQASLVGRQAQLRKLDQAVQPGADGSMLVTLSAVTGMAGVGKTALAVQLAKQLDKQFPDGQFYLDLQGHSGSTKPLTPEAALSILLRHFGASAQQMPTDLGERSALWQTMLAERRAVIVLDDAASAAQVRPLLLNSNTCLTVVTSRRQLASLPDAHAILLDALMPEDAVALFRRFVGEERTQDVARVTRIVQLCGHLPLAIELVANRFRTRSSWLPDTLIERLERSQGRLREIHHDGVEMTSAFDLSYQTLSAEQRAAFRNLSLHPGPEFGTEAAAALLGLSLDSTERLLEDLLTCHLLQEPAPYRYRFHDLIGEFARDLALAAEPDPSVAIQRLASFYIQRADEADRAAYPHRVRLDVPVTESIPALRPMERARDARDWFAAEHANLIAMHQFAHSHDMPEQAALLGHTLAGFLEAECHWDEAFTVLSRAVAHWENTGNQAGLCRDLLELSSILTKTGDWGQASVEGERALQIARSTADFDAIAESMCILGVLHWNRGEYSLALDKFWDHFASKKSEGRPEVLARAHNNIAITLLHMGDFEQSLEHFKRAITNFQKVDDDRRLAKTLSNLGDLHMHTKDIRSARQCFERSLKILESGRDRYSIATVQTNLAGTLTETDEVSAALTLYHSARETFRSLGDKKSQANLENGLGQAHRKAGRHDQAVCCHLRSFDIADSIGALPEAALALRYLATAELDIGKLDAATLHLRKAISFARRIDEPGEYASARVALAEVRFAAGDTTESRQLVEELLGEDQTLDNPQTEAINELLVKMRLTSH